MRYALTAVFCVTLAAAPSLCAAQVESGVATSELRFSRDEVQQMLLDSGASEVTAASMLDAYPMDYGFTEEEVRGLLRSVPQEELLEEYKRRKGVPEADVVRGLTPGARRRVPTARVEELPPEDEGIRPFGYDVFAYSPLEYAPTGDIPVGPDYVLGPGDELYITLWGAVEKNYKALVNREGNIVLPELGVVHASGVTLETFERSLTRRFSGVYSGFSMDVSLGKLRTIQVFVVGDVLRPGAYTISSVSTVFNALYYAGGPAVRGSLRRVLVYRSGELIATVDLYDYLLEGDSSRDIRLRSGDTVFVTTIGPTATIRGAVKRPAVYELMGDESVVDLVDLAGGFTAEAYTERIEVTRVERGLGLTCLAVDLSGQGGADSLGSGGDGFLEAYEEGSTQGSQGDSPRDQEGSSPDSPEADAARSPGDVRVADGDDVTVYTVWHVFPKEYVSIAGAIQFPGTHALSPGMRVSDLVFKAGGLLDQAYLLRAEVSRIEEEPESSGLMSDVIFVNVGEVVRAPHSEGDILLKTGDKVFVRQIPGWRRQHLVKVRGEVRFPGTYTLREKEERLSYVIERAGGLTPEAFTRGGSVYREGEGRVIVDFSKALAKRGGKDDLLLVDGDSVYIPTYPNTIKVEGAVGRPGSIIFEPGKGADYYVEKTGGFLDQANRGSVRIVRLDGSTETAHKRFWFDPEVEPGNRILVEMKEKRADINWTATIKDAATIVASVATTIYIITRID